jgi:hypothetical protein
MVRVQGEDPHRAATQEVHSRGNRLRDTILNSPVGMEVHPVRGSHNNNRVVVVPQRTNSNRVNLDAQCSPEGMYHILKRSKDSNVVLCKLSTVGRAHRNSSNKQVDILLAKVVGNLVLMGNVARANSSSSSNNALLKGGLIQIPGHILESWVTCNYSRNQVTTPV